MSYSYVNISNIQFVFKHYFSKTFFTHYHVSFDYNRSVEEKQNFNKTNKKICVPDSFSRTNDNVVLLVKVKLDFLNFIAVT